MVIADDATIQKLGETFASQSTPLAKRFRILFTLRNLNNDAAIDAMALGMHVSVSHTL